MKERIVATVVASHEKCEAEVDKRLKFEDKIKRPYFHVKPLDLKQLRNWDAYLDFEMGEGNHERIVVLFERCLIPAANYEQFWVKYARYAHMLACNLKGLNSIHYVDLNFQKVQNSDRPTINIFRYLELNAKKMELKNPYNNGETATKEPQGLDVASPLKKARWYFGTGLNKVDEIR